MNTNQNGKTISEVKDMLDFDGDIVALLGKDPFPGRIAECLFLSCHVHDYFFVRALNIICQDLNPRL